MPTYANFGKKKPKKVLGHMPSDVSSGMGVGFKIDEMALSGGIIVQDNGDL